MMKSNMNNVDSEIISVIKLFSKAIKKKVIKQVVALHDEIDTEKKYKQTELELIKFIKKETSQSFQVSPTDLSRKNIRGTAVEARSMCFVLIKKYLNYKHTDIAHLFNSKNHSLVSNAIKEFRELNYEVKKDRRFLEIYTDIDKKTEEFKNNLWLNHS